MSESKTAKPAKAASKTARPGKVAPAAGKQPATPVKKPAPKR